MTQPIMRAGASNRRLWIIAATVLAICVLVVIGIYAIAGSEPTDTIRGEILSSVASTLLQLALIGIVGVAVKYLFDRVIAERAEAKETEARAEAQAEARRAEEKADAARLAERRAATNELRKDLLRKLLSINRELRRVRFRTPVDGSAKTYGRLAGRVFDLEVELWDLMHEIKTRYEADGLFRKEVAGNLIDLVTGMARYLQLLVSELKTRSEWAASGAQDPPDGPPVLQSFLGSVEHGEYRNEYMERYWEARRVLRQEIRKGAGAWEDWEAAQPRPGG